MNGQIIRLRHLDLNHSHHHCETGSNQIPSKSLRRSPTRSKSPTKNAPNVTILRCGSARRSCVVLMKGQLFSIHVRDATLSLIQTTESALHKMSLPGKTIAHICRTPFQQELLIGPVYLGFGRTNEHLAHIC